MSKNKILTPEDIINNIPPEWRDAPDGTIYPPLEWDEDDDTDCDR